MKLSGKLNEIPLRQLIETFCHERQTGQLWVSFPQQPGIFYFQDGELVDAEVGEHAGAEAVYQALWLTKDASFEFKPGVLPSARTIHETWQMVVLEGLILQGFSRLPKAASKNEEPGTEPPSQTADTVAPLRRPFPAISRANFAGWRRISLVSVIAAVMISIVGVIAAISERRGEKEESIAPVPAVKQAAAPLPSFPEPSGQFPAAPVASQSVAANSSAASSSDPLATQVEGSASSDLSIRREQGAVSRSFSASSEPEGNGLTVEKPEKDRVIQPVSPLEAKATPSVTTPPAQVKAAGDSHAAQKSEAPDLTDKLEQDARPQPQQAVQAPAADKEPIGEQEVIVVVQIEQGRVSQAYVANSRPNIKAYEITALRISRGLRFPASKTGTETVTIKVNQRD